MTKTTKNNTPVANQPSSSPEEIAAAVSIKHQVENDAALHAENETQDARVEENEPLTAELIDKRVEALIVAASGVFMQIEQRSLATNGKAYPLDFDIDAHGLTEKDGTPVQDTGNIVKVNKYDFIARTLTRLQCSGLDMMLRQQRERITRQKDAIQREIRFARNTGGDVAGRVDRMADFLAAMHEQAAMIEVALNAAVEAYALAFGEDYVPKEQAAQIAKTRADSLPAETKAKLAALGC